MFILSWNTLLSDIKKSRLDLARLVNHPGYITTGIMSRLDDAYYIFID